MRRLLMAAVVLAIPISALTLSLSGPASASQPQVLKIKCTGLTGNTSSTVMLTGCNGNTGGSSMPLPVATLAGGGAITWTNGQSTTISTPAISAGTHCPVGDTDVVAKAKVTADTTGSATVGGKAKIEVCIDSAGNVSLPPGKKAKI